MYSIPSRTDVTRVIEETYEFLLPTKSQTAKKRDCQRTKLQDLYRKVIVVACKNQKKDIEEILSGLATSIEKITETLDRDIESALQGDPAAMTKENVIASYPGLFAVAIYRVAHALHVHGIPILPRQMTEIVHSRTGIDIHPGATIAEGFFIDHGTGVVIGETTIIGANVRLYQGVTLGAGTDPMKAGRTKRHPTLDDDVICYANSSILGPVTIGRGSRIGANATVSDDVPADTLVLMPKPELIRKTRVQSSTKIPRHS